LENKDGELKEKCAANELLESSMTTQQARLQHWPPTGPLPTGLSQIIAFIKQFAGKDFRAGFMVSANIFDVGEDHAKSDLERKRDIGKKGHISPYVVGNLGPRSPPISASSSPIANGALSSSP